MLRTPLVVICVLAALLLACASEPTPPPQGGTEATSLAATTATMVATQPPTATPDAATTPAQPVPPATGETTAPTATTAPLAPTPAETAPIAAPQVPTVTAPPTATGIPEPPTPAPATSTPPTAPKATPTVSDQAGSPAVLWVTIAAIPPSLPKYDRDDWKHWTDADDDCQDARNEALIAESRTAITFRTDRKCKVATGEWLTPYSNTVVTEAGMLDVDHMVPLGNAHLSGASSWPTERKERYANYLENPQHLIAVSRGANRSKGARGPEEWKPEDRPYWCQYAFDWITIKDTWALTVTQREHDALSQMLNTCATPPKLMTSGQSQGGQTPGATSTPVPPAPTPTPATRTYASCEAAQAAGEPRVQGRKGSGRGFPKWMVPSARDGDRDGVVCER